MKEGQKIILLKGVVAGDLHSEYINPKAIIKVRRRDNSDPWDFAVFYQIGDEVRQIDSTVEAIHKIAEFIE